MEKDKPIILVTKLPDGGTRSLVWCPFWGRKPDLDKAKEEGRLTEKNAYYEIEVKHEKKDN